MSESKVYLAPTLIKFGCESEVVSTGFDWQRQEYFLEKGQYAQSNFFNRVKNEALARIGKISERKKEDEDFESEILRGVPLAVFKKD